MRTTPANDAASIVADGGAAGEVFRCVDWSVNPLGPTEDWPASLKALVRAMLNTHQATCLFWGPELINLYNDGFVPLLGEKHPAAMGQRARECWSDAWPVVGGLLNDVVTRGTAVLFTEMLIPIVRDGRIQDAWWNYSYSPTFDDSGALAGVLVVATETTAAVAARKQLEVARERESELRKDAEAASRAKDDFLATVSHELRTPLSAILGWSRILLANPEPRRVEKGLVVIERNASAQAKLIEDILDVSRIIAGKLVIDLRRVQLSSVIQNAVESIRPAAEAKRIRIEISIDEVSLELIADEARLQQVVWNLLANAVKFTPLGGDVRIVATKSRSSVLIRVEDTGRGIEAELLPHVFERFRQGDASTTKAVPGLGLGLAIVRHLVELHGGTVEARSEGVGHGAAFEVSLPIRAVEPRAPERAADRETALASERHARPETNDTRDTRDTQRTTAESLSGIRALVVDDEHDARDLVTTVLEEAGAAVTSASSVRAAIDVLTSASFDVIVSDIGMAGEDGYSLIQRVRADDSPVTRHIPALALTAFARIEDRARALAAGFQEHVGKPVDPSVLVNAVATLARRR
jgi:signal transduction histidine kinase/CheY-like chemotaxis protein